MTKRHAWIWVGIGILFFVVRSAWADAGTDEMMKRLDQLSSTIQEQQKEIERLKQALKDQKEQIQSVQQNREEEIKKAVKAEMKTETKTVAQAPPQHWTDRITLSGDMRLRYEGIYNRDQQNPDGSTSEMPNRERFRFRVRLAADGKISDEIGAHVMLGSNDDTNKEATTSNQSFTYDFNDKSIYFYRAYADYKPKWLKGLELAGGKFKNTFLHTDIMWDPDVNPEGAYERYQYDGPAGFRPFIHLGQMEVNEKNLETDDAALFIYQGGFDWKIGPVEWTLAGSFYNWRNLENTQYLDKAQYRTGGGNTFVKDASGSIHYAYEYRLAEAISVVKFKLGPLPVKLIFDYIQNTDDDVPSDQDTAYYAGFGLGRDKDRGDWSINYKYARIEKDALIGSMNDQDFYGANRKGHKVFGSYMLLKNLKFSMAYFYTDPIIDWDPTSPTWSTDKTRGHEDRLQVDFNFLF